MVKRLMHNPLLLIRHVFNLKLLSLVFYTCNERKIVRDWLYPIVVQRLVDKSPLLSRNMLGETNSLFRSFYYNHHNFDLWFMISMYFKMIYWILICVTHGSYNYLGFVLRYKFTVHFFPFYFFSLLHHALLHCKLDRMFHLYLVVGNARTLPLPSSYFVT